MSASEEDCHVVRDLKSSSMSSRPFVLITESYTGPPPLPLPPDDNEEALQGLEGAHGNNDDHASSHSIVPSIATLCNSAIGAGVLSLPLVFKSTGLLGGLLLCLVVAGVEGFTLLVLAKMSERFQCAAYSSLVRAILGKKTATLLSVLMAVYMWGACVAYLIIMADSILSIVQALFVGLSLSRVVLIAAIALTLTPLCLIKRITALSALSSVAIVGFFYTSAAILFNAITVVTSRPDPLEGINLYFTDLSSYLFAIPVVVFGFNCHANVVVVMHELETSNSPCPASSRRSKKLLSMISVILCSVSLIAAGYLSVGFAGYATYLNDTPSNILQALPQAEAWAILARLLIFVIVFGHYPLSHHPARSSLESLFPGLDTGYSVLFSIAFVASSSFAACSVTDLGAVLHFLGGTVASLIIFLLPGLMLMNSAIVKDSREMINGAAGELDEPLLDELRRREAKGIKTGIVYSPRKSWISGLFLVLAASAIMILTIVQVFL
jgi:sodium-coupled neutral amino acid transporter 7/8